MARKSSIKGDFKLRRTLRNIHKTMDNQLKPAMQKAADLVLETQQQLIPVDTGESRAALEAFVSKSGLDAQIGIRGRKNNRRFFFLRFIEYGTKGSKGKRTNPDVNQSNGADFFGYAPDIPSIPAHPWLRPSYDLNRERIKLILKEAIDETLRRASQGASDNAGPL